LGDCALDVLHDEERDGVRAGGGALVADVVQRADVRMVQGRDRARFTLEALAERAGDRLDRNGAIQPRVDRAIDLAHAAGADLRGDFVDAEARAGGETHGRSDTSPIPPASSAPRIS
jgi:hypothetical protein